MPQNPELERLKQQLELLDERLLEIISLRQTISKELGKDKKALEEALKKAQKKSKELNVDPKIASKIIEIISKAK